MSAAATIPEASFSSTATWRQGVTKGRLRNGEEAVTYGELRCAEKVPRAA